MENQNFSDIIQGHKQISETPSHVFRSQVNLWDAVPQIQLKHFAQQIQIPLKLVRTLYHHVRTKVSGQLSGQNVQLIYLCRNFAIIIGL